MNDVSIVAPSFHPHPAPAVRESEPIGSLRRSSGGAGTPTVHGRPLTTSARGCGNGPGANCPPAGTQRWPSVPVREGDHARVGAGAHRESSLRTDAAPDPRSANSRHRAQILFPVDDRKPKIAPRGYGIAGEPEEIGLDRLRVEILVRLATTKRYPATR